MLLMEDRIMMTNPAQSQPSETQNNSSPNQNDGAQQSPTNIQHSAFAQQFLQNQLINQKQVLNPALGNANILGMPNFVNMSVESTNQQIQAQLLQSLMAQNFMQTSHFGQGSDEQQLYEYMQQLIDEKEKLKDLNSEPFNLALPMCAKLLDEASMAIDIPNTAEYLAQLLKDKKQLAAFPNVFMHLERILDEEISRVRTSLFQLGAKEAVCLPEPVGPIIQFTEKLYVPVKDYPDFNFVGRILGPRGMTAKQLEQETGCKIMVRGKGSMRDKAKEEQMKGKPNWEHLNDELHVLVTCEDAKNRAEIKLKRAGEEIKKLLVPSPEGEDELKKKQLMELAIINGTYRDSSKLHKGMNPILIPGGNVLAAAAAAVGAGNGMKSPPNPLGQSLILSPRFSSNGANQATQLTDPTTGLIYTTIPTIYSDQAALNSAQQSSILDYSNGLDFSQNGSLKAQRFSAINSAAIRAHPYARVALS